MATRTQVRSGTVDRKQPPRERLSSVLLPGHIGKRARNAAGLPAWATGLIGVVCFGLSIELIAYVHAVAQHFLQTIYGQWQEAFQIPVGAAWVFLEVAMQHMRLHVLPVDGSSESLMIAAGIAGCGAAMLESINLVMLAPMAASYGQSLRDVSGQTRRVLLVLGSVWLLEASAVWAGLFLWAGVVTLYYCQMLRIRVAYAALDNMVQMGFGAVLLGVLLCWLMGLVWAASYLRSEPEAAVRPRCGRCGYLLEGLIAGSSCPDCGMTEPSGGDARREASPWLGRRKTGRLWTLTRVSREAAGAPGGFFARLQVLPGHREVLRFARWNVWLSVLVWVTAIPGISAGLIGPDEFVIGNQVVTACIVAGLVAGMTALTGVLLVGLLTSVLGFAIGIAREEPGWPIAAGAGWYLSAWLPRVAAGQALWVTVVFTIEQVTERGVLLRLSQYAWIATGIPWEVVLSAMFGWPLLAGFVVMARGAVVCYRGVRYAGR